MSETMPKFEQKEFMFMDSEFRWYEAKLEKEYPLLIETFDEFIEERLAKTEKAKIFKINKSLVEPRLADYFREKYHGKIDDEDVYYDKARIYLWKYLPIRYRDNKKVRVNAPDNLPDKMKKLVEKTLEEFGIESRQKDYAAQVEEIMPDEIKQEMAPEALSNSQGTQSSIIDNSSTEETETGPEKEKWGIGRSLPEEPDEAALQRTKNWVENKRKLNPQKDEK